MLKSYDIEASIVQCIHRKVCLFFSVSAGLRVRPRCVYHLSSHAVFTYRHDQMNGDDKIQGI